MKSTFRPHFQRYSTLLYQVFANILIPASLTNILLGLRRQWSSMGLLSSPCVTSSRHLQIPYCPLCTQQSSCRQSGCQMGSSDVKKSFSPAATPWSCILQLYCSPWHPLAEPDWSARTESTMPWGTGLCPNLFMIYKGSGWTSHPFPPASLPPVTFPLSSQPQRLCPTAYQGNSSFRFRC